MGTSYVKRVQQIGRTPDIENPHRCNGPPGHVRDPQRGTDGKNSRDQITVRGGYGPCLWQGWGNNTGYQEAEADKTDKHVRHHQPKQRLLTEYSGEAPVLRDMPAGPWTEFHAGEREKK